MSDAGIRIFSSTAGVLLLSFLNLYMQKVIPLICRYFQISRFQEDYNRSRNMFSAMSKEHASYTSINA